MKLRVCQYLPEIVFYRISFTRCHTPGFEKTLSFKGLRIVPRLAVVPVMLLGRNTHTHTSNKQHTNFVALMCLEAFLRLVSLMPSLKDGSKLWKLFPPLQINLSTFNHKSKGPLYIAWIRELSVLKIIILQWQINHMLIFTLLKGQCHEKRCSTGALRRWFFTLSSLICIINRPTKH